VNPDATTPPSPPTKPNVSLEALISLGVEHWRLATCLTSVDLRSASAQARHALRRMEDVLRDCGLEVRNMDGLPFDAGLAARVIDTVDDPRLAEGSAVISETLSPLVLWRGAVVKAADVVTRRGTKR
jgi:hypothetical protein